MSKIHPSEPTLAELQVILKELIGLEGTEENVKKAEAILKQIDRHKAAA
jgi:hypothetical protein